MGRFSGERGLGGIGLLALVFSGLAQPLPAQAYPTYIRLGYVSCAACHVSPQGAGSLTEYGKGVGASASLVTREYAPPESTWYDTFTWSRRINHGLRTRVLHYESGGASDTFLMQLDYLNSTALTERLRIDATLGLTPPIAIQSRSAGNGALGERLILRKAMVAYRPEDGHELAAGRDFLPTGLSIPDHTSFLRSRNRRGPTDYFTQVRYDTWAGRWLMTPYVFGPSYEENASSREYGAGARAEYAWLDTASMGATALYGNAPGIDRWSLGAFSRLGLGSSAGVLAEYVFTHRTLADAGSSGFGQQVLYLRPYVAPFEWMEIGFVGEMLRRTTPFEDKAYQYGPTVNLRVIRELTLILDGRWVSRGPLTQGTFSIQGLGQL